MPWDKQKAAQYARNNAKNHSTGYCARYVTDAINYGGISIPKTQYAKDMGNTLAKAGFQPINGNIDVGDVAVIQDIAGHPYGHVCIYDGNNWVSDFVQSTMYPGKAYRDASPPYVIFRY